MNTSYVMQERSMAVPAIARPTDFPEPELTRFQPVRLLEVELSESLPPISAYDAQTDRHYQHARVLVRLHTKPLGLIDLRLDQEVQSPDAYVGQIWQTLQSAINAHLSQDGLPEVNGVDTAGLPCSKEPACLQERRRCLVQAPFVSVIVCTRDRTEQLAACLPSLLKLDYPHFEIIVVDNAPKTSATADLIRERYGHLPQVRYVREDRPGLSWARNCGLQQAQGEIVAYTDDDVLVDPYWLAELAQGFQITENVACVTGLTLSAELETLAQDWFEQFGGLSKGRGFKGGIFDNTRHRAQNPLYPAPALGAGVNMAFKTSILRGLGGFDPALGAGTLTAGGEDTLAFYKVIHKGFTLVYEPAVLVRHFHRRDYAGLRKQLYGYGIAVTAFFTKCLLDDPKCVVDLVRLLPNASSYLLSPQSPRIAERRANYPHELDRIELLGMAYGPLAYLRSLWHKRQIVGQFGPLEFHAPASTTPVISVDGAHLEPELTRFQPVRLLEVELSESLPPISAYDAQTDRHYQHARVLVRLHTKPLGLIDLRLDQEVQSPDAYVGQIWQTLQSAINAHLSQDGLPEVNELDATGLPYSKEPACLQERRRCLVQAPFVSVIICTRDRTEQLAACLPSLLKLDYPHFEIIVVDNAPKTSATADLIREHYGHLSQVRYVREDRPGTPWARNRGLQQAQGEIIAYTDDDVLVDPYWLAELAQGFQIAENVACVSGQILAAELETQAQDWLEQASSFTKGFTRVIHNVTTHRLKHPLYPYSAIKYGSSANVAFKTQVLRALGGFDPAFLQGQDIDAYFRVTAKGYTMVYEPAAVIRHFHRRDYAGFRKQIYNYGIAFTAFVTKSIVQDPKLILFLISRLPNALFAVFSPRAPKNQHKRTNYPRELTQLEFRGMLYGPFVYLRRQWHVRQIVKQFGPLDLCAKSIVPGNVNN